MKPMKIAIWFIYFKIDEFAPTDTILQEVRKRWMHQF